MNVIHINDVSTDDVNIKKPVSYPSNRLSVFDLYYRNKFFLVLVDRMHICNIGEKSMRFVFANCGVEQNRVRLVERKLIERIRLVEAYAPLFENREHRSILCDNESMLNIRDISELDTPVFDLSGNIIDIPRLKFQDKVRLILYVKSIWVNERYYGLTVKIAQIERTEPMGSRVALFPQSVYTRPSPPPPPPPPLSLKNINVKHHIKKKKTIDDTDKRTTGVIRPSVAEIMESMNKLRKTNILY